MSSIVLDPNDPNTVWVGTGEANASVDSEAGVGIYKSTDGGDTDGPLGKSRFNARAVGTIAIDPSNSNTIYAGSTRAVRGISAFLAAVPCRWPRGQRHGTAAKNRRNAAHGARRTRVDCVGIGRIDGDRAHRSRIKTRLAQRPVGGRRRWSTCKCLRPLRYPRKHSIRPCLPKPCWDRWDPARSNLQR